jgi:DNA-directed RNA polymerase III subunit RPC2
VLEPNHVIVNKYSPLNQTDLGDGGYSPNKQEYKHTKMSYKGTAPSTVDKVMITSNENENFIIKVRMSVCVLFAHRGSWNL